MDNSATSYPKPPSVIRAVRGALNNYIANPGRSSSKEALSSSNALYDSRTALAELVGTVPENIVFTYNATYALNMAILGTIFPGMTVAFDPFAHNSVLRPLYALEEKGVTLIQLDADLFRDSVMIYNFEQIVRKQKVDALVLTHTSNVTGKVLPVKRMSEICRENNVLLIVDVSQGLGSSKINMEEMGIDILASSGHKGLYGIMGTGFLAFRESCPVTPEPLITGGSGIFSLNKDMPSLLPERLEAGTLGLPGIISMKAGAEFLMKTGVEEIGERERLLRARLVGGLSDIYGVKVYNADVNARSIVLFNVSSISPEIVAQALDREGIAVRAGYHCAPLVHNMISRNDPQYSGAVRLSVGYFNTEKQCEKVIAAVRALSKEINDKNSY